MQRRIPFLYQVNLITKLSRPHGILWTGVSRVLRTMEKRRLLADKSSRSVRLYSSNRTWNPPRCRKWRMFGKEQIHLIEIKRRCIPRTVGMILSIHQWHQKKIEFESSCNNYRMWLLHLKSRDPPIAFERLNLRKKYWKDRYQVLAFVQ